MNDRPFRLADPAPLHTSDRSGDARFQRLPFPVAAEVEKESKDSGRPLQAVAQERVAPLHAVPAQAPKGSTGGFREQLPWAAWGPPEGVPGYSPARLPVRFRG